MAESILCSLAGSIITKLGSFALQDLGLLWGFHDELDKLKGTVSALEAVLLDAEEKQSKSRAVKDWILKLKDTFYDIDDLLDVFSYESLKRQVMTKHRTNNTKKVRIFFSKSNQIAFRLKMSQKIKRVREKLDAIAMDKTQFNLYENTREIQDDESTKRLETTSFIREGEIIGRDDDKKSIIHYLLDTNIHEDSVAEIVTKLKGSPLAIRVIGSYLYSKKSEKDWLSFKDHELDTIMQQENEIQSILKISFNHLSSSLKHCFTYCALFSKDYHHEIRKNDLIKQWMAQGFIQPHNKKAMEDVGDDYFEELLGRSFFQDIRKNKWGEINKFKMHDIIHDLACSVVENDCVLANDDTKSIDKRTRHVSISAFNSMTRWKLITKSLIEAKNLRTLNYARRHHIDLSNHLRLRTLNLEFHFVPKCIGKMKHLRYINITYCYIDFLPKAVTKLYHLETLIIRGCLELRELSSDIKNLINLRHLDIKDFKHVWSYMPKGMGSMTTLQTMNLFILGENKGGELSELNGLVNLRGSLSIQQLQFCKPIGLENVKYLEEKSRIQKLELHWKTYQRESKIDDEDERVLESLKPHSNLQKIRIEGYRGLKLCNWFSFDSIVNLVFIKLFNCEKLQQLPRFDRFPFLKHLHLEDLPSIEYIAINNYVSSSMTTFFPSLENLSIIKLPNLKEWWKGESIDQNTSFPTILRHLSQLKIHYCRQLASIPQHGPLQSLDIRDISLQLFELVIKMTATNIIVGEDSSSSANDMFIRSSSSLKIWKIDWEFLPNDLFSNVTHLQSLVIGRCFNLKMSFDDDNVRWKELGSLRTLRLCFIPKLEYLPKGFQYLKALEHLELLWCENLACILGIEHLTSLSRLEISNCPNLTSLPEGMTQLISLTCLIIDDCPNLSTLPEGLHHLLNTPRYAPLIFSH
uniref:Uncharacterized protein n=1 Tax=Cucumis sativus TaxID=3659 RepID=A0A0A0KIT2_CUCSA